MSGPYVDLYGQGCEMRDQRYIEIPGCGTHELPPLLVHAAAPASQEPTVELAAVMSEAEDMLASNDDGRELMEQRKFELALQLMEQYKGLLAHWFWGDDVLEWIRQCETTFENENTLRQLLHPDVWPHASRASFVTLLREKEIPTHGVALERAVGFRLMFREPSPAHCFSSEFLFYLNSILADTAYRSWAGLSDDAPVCLPPERFHFEVLDVGA
jgi:hypothetical protein